MQHVYHNWNLTIKISFFLFFLSFMMVMYKLIVEMTWPYQNGNLTCRNASSMYGSKPPIHNAPTRPPTVIMSLVYLRFTDENLVGLSLTIFPWNQRIYCFPEKIAKYVSEVSTKVAERQQAQSHSTHFNSLNTPTNKMPSPYPISVWSRLSTYLPSCSPVSPFVCLCTC